MRQPGLEEYGGGLTDVPGIQVGHFTDARRPTGCTVILCESGAVAGVDVRGGAPGTRETDLLHPMNTVERVHAIVFSGGSAFGLDTASGVMRYLEEKGIGYRVGSIAVPIVPAAILFDLQLGDPAVRPTAESGYLACRAAATGKIAEGNVGAGAGATVGKLFGLQHAMKGGLGTASVRVGETGVIVAALAVVNAAGDVYRSKDGTLLAGARAENGTSLRNSMQEILRGKNILPADGAPVNTTLGVVATNARMTKSQAAKLAQMAHDGYARAIQPVHTPLDGDTVFALATGSHDARADLGAIGSIGACVMARAIERGITQARGIPGYPSFRDLQKSC
jgi:L-aminopeptidase/D-esterase-like protein